MTSRCVCVGYEAVILLDSDIVLDILFFQIFNATCSSFVIVYCNVVIYINYTTFNNIYAMLFISVSIFIQVCYWENKNLPMLFFKISDQSFQPYSLAWNSHVFILGNNLDLDCKPQCTRERVIRSAIDLRW